MTKLLLPMNEDRVEIHEIIMTDVADLIEEYREYLTERFDGTSPKVIERLVFSYSDALWAAVLGSNLSFREARSSLVARFCAWLRMAIDAARETWNNEEQEC